MILCTLAALVCMLPRPAVESETVTLRMPATRLENAAPILSKAIGKPVTVTNSAKDEILVMSVKDVPTDQVADGIEKALYVEIDRRKDQWIISQPKSMRKKMEADSYAYRLRNATEMVEDAKEQYRALPPMNKQRIHRVAQEINKLRQEREYDLVKGVEDSRGNTWDKLEKYLQELPAPRLVLRLTSDLDPSMIARIREGQRLTFSLRPGKQVHALKSKALQWVEEGLNDQELWDRFLGEDDALNVSTRKIKDVFVSVTCASSYLNYSFFVVSNDDSVQFFSENRFGLKNAYTPRERTDLLDLDLEKNVESELTKRLIASINNRRQTRFSPVDQSLSSAFSDPLNNDPLSFQYSESLFSYAKKCQMNVIAPGVDSLFLYSIADDWVNLFSDEQGLLSRQDFDGLMVLKSKNPVYQKMIECDRRFLKLAIRSFLKYEHLELEDVGRELSRKSVGGVVHSQPLFLIYQSLFHRTDWSTIPPQATFLLAAFSDAEKTQALRQGIFFSELTYQSQQALSSLLFNDLSDYDEYTGFAVESEISPDVVSEGREVFLRMAKEKPETLFKDGLPSNLLLRFEDRREEYFGVKSLEAGEQKFDGLSCYELASRLGFTKESKAIFKPIDMNCLSLGSNRKVNLRIAFGNQVSWKLPINAYYLNWSKQVSYTDILRIIREKLEKGG